MCGFEQTPSRNCQNCNHQFFLPEREQAWYDAKRQELDDMNKLAFWKRGLTDEEHLPQKSLPAYDSLRGKDREYMAGRKIFPYFVLGWKDIAFVIIGIGIVVVLGYIMYYYNWVLPFQ
jgi:hypothetical protein